MIIILYDWQWVVYGWQKKKKKTHNNVRGKVKFDFNEHCEKCTYIVSIYDLINNFIVPFNNNMTCTHTHCIKGIFKRFDLARFPF